MTSKYFVVFVFIMLVACSTKPMGTQNYSKKIEDFRTLITFQNKTKTIYQFMRDDRDKPFGYTPLYRCKENNADDNTRFVKVGTIKTLHEEQMINAIASGYCYYYDSLKQKTIGNDKIEIGAIVDFQRTATLTNPIDYPLFHLGLQRLWLIDKMFRTSGQKKIQRLNVVSVTPTITTSAVTASTPTASTATTTITTNSTASLTPITSSSTTSSSTTTTSANTVASNITT